MALVDPTPTGRPEGAADPVADRSSRLHRLNSIDASIGSLHKELRTQNGQLIALTAMVCLLGVLVVVAQQQVLEAIAGD